LEGRPLTTEVPPVTSTHGYRVKGPVEELRALRGRVAQRSAGQGWGWTVQLMAPVMRLL
jgi:hypothetical protein